MKIKKNPKANLEHYSGVFTLLGLVLTLFISYVVLEHKSYAAIKHPDVYKPTTYDEQETITYVHLPKPKIQAPKVQEFLSEPKIDLIKEPVAKPDANNFNKTENENLIQETPLTPSNENTSKIDQSSIIYDKEEEALVEETIHYVAVQNVPVFPGCEKYKDDKKKSMQCFSKGVSKFFNKNFDTEIANDLNLQGVQNIGCVFVIDTNGQIKPDVKTSKTHPELAKEIKSILKKLPKMQPAKQNGKAVNMMYSLPIRFRLE